ncbi:FMRFamide receptor-like [Plakobranchus ocellatus]|uniref:FMRFamide receptor-like n=1 Tax=Plakobranchus ocellatus TaxID=259542 RepID=A0AAV4C0A3_9GAST|nr:FMRFamide receptor-like [Plakobranchus ocellatus]
MEMNINVNFQERYLALEQVSTPAAANASDGLLPGNPLSQGQGSCGGNGTEEYETFYRTAQFVTGLVLYPIFCITGILGNSLSLIVLSHKDMATSTNVYLLALGISDSLKLLNDFLYSVMLVISFYNPTASETMMVNVYPYAHYVFQVAVCVTAWLTVSVSMDRYVSVCYPSRSRDICTIPRARTVVISVFIIMLLLSIPSVFRYRFETIHDPVQNITCMELVVTELGRNQQFMIPYTWVQNFLRGIIPVFILIFLNARIIKALYKERVKGKKFNSRNRITLMLIAMVVIFIVCITPDAIMSTFFGKGYVEEDFLVKGIREITDALVAFNSAVNFLLYCSLSVVFRDTFTRVFFGRRYAKMGRRGSNLKLSKDGNSVGASLKRLSHKDGKTKTGSTNARDREREEEMEENKDLIENGSIQLMDLAGDVGNAACASDDNNRRQKFLCQHHGRLDTQIASFVSCDGSTDIDYERGSGNDRSSSSSPGSHTGSTKKQKKISGIFLDFTKSNGFKKRGKKSLNGNSSDRKHKAKDAARSSASDSQDRPKSDRPRKPADVDLSYLTSSVYLGPGTDTSPFEMPANQTISAHCSHQSEQ